MDTDGPQQLKGEEGTSVLNEKRKLAEAMRLSKGRGKDEGQALKGKGCGAAGAADA